MKSHVDLLNTFLILLSVALAFYFPFELFLLMYAILGPLHYLTEINWIRDKKYVVKNKYWIYIIIIFSLGVALPHISKLLKSTNSSSIFYGFVENVWSSYTNGLILMALVLAYAFLYVPNLRNRILLVVLSCVVILLVNNLEAFNIWVGVFLPTIIHVYLFTMLFMWYGNLKSKANFGSLNVVLMAVVPLFIFLINVDGSQYNISENVQSTIVDNSFYLLNTNLSKVFGLTDGTTFVFNDIIDIKIQIFIAFSYTYHYLNWFSKTSVIGWHKKLTTKKSLTIGVVWIMSVALYTMDYKMGLALLLMLSMMHVFLEFPLNIMSVKAIFSHYLKKFQKA